MGFVQGVVKFLLVFVLNIFFREAKGLNVDKLPKKDPLIFVCAPHANQVLFISLLVDFPFFLLDSTLPLLL